MIALLLASMMAAHAPGPSTTNSLCKKAIAKKAGGEIKDIEQVKSRVTGSTRTTTGNVTVFIGMGPPDSGSASAHHLIRATYVYNCVVRGSRVRSLKLSQ